MRWYECCTFLVLSTELFCAQNEFMELARLKGDGPEYAIRQDYSPEMFAARCGAAGLFTSISSDPENIYIRIGIPLI